METVNDRRFAGCAKSDTSAKLNIVYKRGDMITAKQKREAQVRAAALIRASGIPVSREEQDSIEVADFGLSRLEEEGAQILTWVQTDRMGAKVIALLPGQTLPEHWHPRVGDDAGKEETIRHVAGDLFVYIEGSDTMTRGRPPEGKEEVYTCRHEIVPRPGEQITFEPLEKHWFRAGPAGAVAYSFSTVVRDALDGFTDDAVRRITEVVE